MTDTSDTGYTTTEVVLRESATVSKRYPNYECNLCAFATIFKEKIDEHIGKNIHVWGAPGKPGIPEAPIEIVDAKESPKY